MAWGLDLTRGEARDAGAESERSYILEGTDDDPELALLADAVETILEWGACQTAQNEVSQHEGQFRKGLEGW